MMTPETPLQKTIRESGVTAQVPTPRPQRCCLRAGHQGRHLFANTEATPIPGHDCDAVRSCHGTALDELIDEAESRGLWLYGVDKDIWFSPAELRLVEWSGWRAEMFQLRDPGEHLRDLERSVEMAKNRLVAFRRRLS